MLFKKYVSEMANLKSRNKLNTVVILVLTVTVLMLGISMISASRQHTVIIVPKGIDQTVTVGQSTASKEYLLAMGNYVTFLFLNFDETTVVNQYDTLSALSSGAVRTEAVMLAEGYKKNHISSRAVIQRIEATDKDITVVGRRAKYIMDKEVEGANFTLTIKYIIQFGTFRVEELFLK